MTQPILSPEACRALEACLVTRGKNKGQLKAKPPSPFKDETRPAYAAWQGAMLSVNPFKASIVGMMLMREPEQAIFEEVKAFFDARPELRGLDRDRRALESLGVW